MHKNFVSSSDKSTKCIKQNIFNFNIITYFYGIFSGVLIALFAVLFNVNKILYYFWGK